MSFQQQINASAQYCHLNCPICTNRLHCGNYAALGIELASPRVTFPFPWLVRTHLLPKRVLWKIRKAVHFPLTTQKHCWAGSGSPMPQTVLSPKFASHSSTSFLVPFGTVSQLHRIESQLTFGFFYLSLDALVFHLGQNFPNKCLNSNSRVSSDFSMPE